MTFGKGRTIDKTGRPVVAKDWEWGGEGWIDGTQTTSGQWNYCVWYYNHRHMSLHLSKPSGCTTPRVDPFVNYGLQLILTLYHYFVKIIYLNFKLF